MSVATYAMYGTSEVISTYLKEVFGDRCVGMLMKYVPKVYRAICAGTYLLLSKDRTAIDALVKLYLDIVKNRAHLSRTQLSDEELRHEEEAIRRDIEKFNDENLLNLLRTWYFGDSLLTILYRLGAGKSLAVREIEQENRSLWKNIEELLKEAPREDLEIMSRLVRSTRLDRVLKMNFVLTLLNEVVDDIKTVILVGALPSTITRSLITIETKISGRSRRREWEIVSFDRVLLLVREIVESAKMAKGDLPFTIDDVYRALDIYGGAREIISISVGRPTIEGIYIVIPVEVFFEGRSLGAKKSSSVVGVGMGGTALNTVVFDAMNILESNGIIIAGDPDKQETVVAKVGDDGFEIVYPFRARYGWKDLRELLHSLYRSGFSSGIVWKIATSFKSHASMHGVVYPDVSPYAYETVFESRNPRITITKSVIDGRDCYELYTLRNRFTATNFADLIEQLIKSDESPRVKEVVLNAVRSKKIKLPAEEIEKVVKSAEEKRFDFVLKVSKAIGENLHKGSIGDLEVWMNPEKTIGVSIGQRIRFAKEVEKQLQRINIDKVCIYLTDYLVEKLEELRNVGICCKIVDNKLLIPITSKKISKSLIESIGRIAGVTIEVGGGYTTYPEAVFNILRRLGTPDEILAGPDTPLILRYGDKYIHIAPKIEF